MYHSYTIFFIPFRVLEEHGHPLKSQSMKILKLTDLRNAKVFEREIFQLVLQIH